VDESKPSKSARKREYLALQKLGEDLVTLRESELLSIPLDEDLLEAVREARRIKAHGALRRQKQYIGKLMRHVDPEPINAALERLRRK
jgi:ribosome-associated protein